MSKGRGLQHFDTYINESCFVHIFLAPRFIIVDLPPEEAGSFVKMCRKWDLTYIPLVTPTTANGENFNKLRINTFPKCL